MAVDEHELEAVDEHELDPVYEHEPDAVDEHELEAVYEHELEAPEHDSEADDFDRRKLSPLPSDPQTIRNITDSDEGSDEGSVYDERKQHSDDFLPTESTVQSGGIIKKFGDQNSIEISLYEDNGSGQAEEDEIPSIFLDVDGVDTENDSIDYDPDEYDYYTTDDHYPHLLGGKFVPSSGKTDLKNISSDSDKLNINEVFNATATYLTPSQGSMSNITGYRHPDAEKINITVPDDPNYRNYDEYDYLPSTNESDSLNVSSTVGDSLQNGTQSTRGENGSLHDHKIENENDDFSPIDDYEQYEYAALKNETDSNYDLINVTDIQKVTLPNFTTDNNVTLGLFKTNTSLLLEEESLKEQKQLLLLEKDKLELEKGNLSQIEEIANRIQQISQFLIGITQREIDEDINLLEKKQVALDAEEDFIARQEQEMDYEGSGVEEDVMENLNEVVDQIEQKKSEIDREKSILQEEKLFLVDRNKTFDKDQNETKFEIKKVEDKILSVEENEREVEESLVNIENEELDLKVNEFEEEKINLQALDNVAMEGKHRIEKNEKKLDEIESDIIDENDMIGAIDRDIETHETKVHEDTSDILNKEEILRKEAQDLQEEHLSLLDREEALKEKEREIKKEIDDIEEERDDIIDREISIALEESKLDEEKIELEEKIENITKKEADLGLALNEIGERDKELAIDKEIIRQEEELLEEEEESLNEDQNFLEQEGLILAGQAKEVAEILDEMDAQEDDLLKEKSDVDEELRQTQEQEELVHVLVHGIKDRNESLVHEEEIMVERELVIIEQKESKEKSTKDFLETIDGVDTDEEELLEEKVDQDLLESELEAEKRKVKTMETVIIEEESELEKEEDSLSSYDGVLVIDGDYSDLNESSIEKFHRMNDSLDSKANASKDASEEDLHVLLEYPDGKDLINITETYDDVNDTSLYFDRGTSTPEPTIDGEVFPAFTSHPDSTAIDNKSKPHLGDVEIYLTTDETAQEIFDGTIDFIPENDSRDENVLDTIPVHLNESSSTTGHEDDDVNLVVPTRITSISGYEVTSTAPPIVQSTVGDLTPEVDDVEEFSEPDETTNLEMTEPSPPISTERIPVVVTTSSAISTSPAVVPGKTAGTIEFSFILRFASQVLDPEFNIECRSASA